MKHTLSIVDDFIPEALELRETVLQHLNFETVEHDGHAYPGIARNPFPQIGQALRRYPGLESAQILHDFFRLNGANESATSWIHADIGMGTHAAVWYLNPDPPAENGTAFWRHAMLGWDGLPSAEELETERYDMEKLADLLRGDSNDPEKWEKRMIVPGDFNRLILYPTGLFHSRWPQHSFGASPATARLIYVAFLAL